jgi:hypothetical protein
MHIDCNKKSRYGQTSFNYFVRMVLFVIIIQTRDSGDLETEIFASHTKLSIVFVSSMVSTCSLN